MPSLWPNWSSLVVRLARLYFPFFQRYWTMYRFHWSADKDTRIYLLILYCSKTQCDTPVLIWLYHWYFVKSDLVNQFPSFILLEIKNVSFIQVLAKVVISFFWSIKTSSNCKSVSFTFCSIVWCEVKCIRNRHVVNLTLPKCVDNQFFIFSAQFLRPIASIMDKRKCLERLNEKM